MDMVRECEFDFEEVAARLSKIAPSVVDAPYVDCSDAVALTVQDCRLRYTHLDMLEGALAFGSGIEYERCDDNGDDNGGGGGEEEDRRGNGVGQRCSGETILPPIETGGAAGERRRSVGQPSSCSILLRSSGD